jgi:hypothetical protein
MDDLKATALESMEKLLSEGLVDNRIFAQMVEYVYENTTDRYVSEGGKQVPRDELRTLLSACASANIEKWMAFNEFSKMVINNGEFAVDVLCQLKNNRTAFDVILAARKQKATK